MNEITVMSNYLSTAADSITNEVATPYLDNEKKFFETIREFSESAFISNASKVKAQQIINLEPQISDMYRCMLDYVEFLEMTKKEFKQADLDSVDMFHKHTF